MVKAETDEQRIDREDLERRPFRDAGAPLADLGEGLQRRLRELVTRTLAEPESAERDEATIARRAVALARLDDLGDTIESSGRNLGAIVAAALQAERRRR